MPDKNSINFFKMIEQNPDFPQIFTMSSKQFKLPNLLRIRKLADHTQDKRQSMKVNPKMT